MADGYTVHYWYGAGKSLGHTVISAAVEIKLGIMN